ncbi:glycosyltransferase, partial [Streptomyces sp. SID3212]|uniref:glycosyltransferase n=1 Tax=Streptomyces sp. SID3212 TaxID=2690259 RepID=UPI00136E0B45
MPGGVDDPAAPSGGNRYDRRVCGELPRAGWPVHEHAVAGTWPDPGPEARAELARILAESADGSVVLLDGLVACAAPDVVVPEATRLRLAVLVHLPLADETGLTPERAAELNAAERRTLHAVSAVIATSTWAATRLITLHDLPASRVHVAPPGTDTAPLSRGSAVGTAVGTPPSRSAAGSTAAGTAPSRGAA